MDLLYSVNKFDGYLKSGRNDETEEYMTFGEDTCTWMSFSIQEFMTFIHCYT